MDISLHLDCNSIVCVVVEDNSRRGRKIRGWPAKFGGFALTYAGTSDSITDLLK